MDVCYFYLLPVGPFFSEAERGEQRKITGRKVREKKNHPCTFCTFMQRMDSSISCLSLSRRGQILGETMRLVRDGPILFVKHGDTSRTAMRVLFSYAQLNGIARVRMLDNQLYACDFIFYYILCGHDNKMYVRMNMSLNE